MQHAAIWVNNELSTHLCKNEYDRKQKQENKEEVTTDVHKLNMNVYTKYEYLSDINLICLWFEKPYWKYNDMHSSMGY